MFYEVTITFSAPYRGCTHNEFDIVKVTKKERVREQ